MTTSEPVSKNGRVFYAFLAYHHMMIIAENKSPMSKKYFIPKSINRFSNNGIAIIDALGYVGDAILS